MRAIRTLACATLLLAPAIAAACEEGGDGAPPPFETRLVVRQGAWLEDEVDSTWIALDPGLFLVPLRRPAGAWIAETWYFRLPAWPAEVFTFDEMNALERAGAIDERTESGLVVDQVLLYARDPAQAARLARAMRPQAPPSRVLDVACRP
jgi:hypothetical protein